MTPEDALTIYEATNHESPATDLERNYFKAGFLFGSHIAATEYLASKLESTQPQEASQEPWLELLSAEVKEDFLRWREL